MNLEEFYVYDIETFKRAFTLSVIRLDGKHKKVFEVSKFTNDIEGIYKCLDYIESTGYSMIGYNNLAFDYPIIHQVLKSRRSFMKLSGEEIALKVWELAQKQIDSFKDNQFGNLVKTVDVIIPQIDLYKIHHFDNRARSTSLKMLEFNMRMTNIEDLPYGIEDELSEDQIAKLKSYNEHDTEATRKFALISAPQIDFRIALTEKHGRSFMNHNDGKIGNDYFVMELESKGVELYSYDSKGKRKMRQSKRPYIKINECVFEYYDFKRPECIAILEWFKKQRITETKGVFSDILESDLFDVAKYAKLETKSKKFKSKPTEAEISKFKNDYPMGWIEEQELKATETVIIDGVKTKVPKKSYWMKWKVATTLNIIMDDLRIDFGTGGIHASRSEVIAKENARYVLLDKDVSSQYPNLGISNRVFPEHLSEDFCDIYEDVYNQRKSYKKGTPENAMLKLALNATYGNSNNQYSVFYDPKYTISITVNGQLSILLLAEKLLEVPGLRLIQLNTDGLTCAVPRDGIEEYQKICSEWESQVKLELEESHYTKMFIRDVNNYVALYDNGKIKYKGAYVWKREELGWHQNQGGLIIPMAACAAMIDGVDIREFILNHAKNPDNKFDFCLRTKVPRSSKLMLVYEDGRQEQQQNICRYYPCKTGGKLVKLMPALEGKEADGERELSIDASWNVKTCNNIADFSFDDVDYDYYVAEAEKLVIN